MSVREWWGRLWRSGDVDAARARVDMDAERVTQTAERIDKGAGSLEDKVRVNHISATVTALLRGSR